MVMRESTARWLRVAERDLESGHTLLNAGIYEHVAFHCQQAGKRALKALYVETLAHPRTHSGVELPVGIRQGGISVGESVFAAARRLDRCFIDSRYPNGVGTSPEQFTAEEFTGMLPPRDGVREVEPQLTTYLTALRRRIPVRALVVFGSRARNDHWEDSDIDLLVVSDEFGGTPRRDRIGLLLEDWMQSPALEPLGYTAEEVMRADHLVLLDALWQGRPVFDDGIWQQATRRLRERVDQGEWTPTAMGWRERI